MPTVDDVARQAIAAVATDANHLVACKWVVDRWRQIAARTQFRRLRTIGELSVPAPVNAGTVTIARDSKTLTGNAAAQAVWSSDLAGWYVRVNVVWYEIEGFISNTLKLRAAFAEDSVTAGTYNIIQRFVPLDQTARWIGNKMWNQRRRLPIERIQLEELNDASPERPFQPGDSSRVFAMVGDRVSTDGKMCIGVELYPYSTTSEMYNYVFWPVTMDLAITDDIPSMIDPHVLSEGVLADIMRYEMGKAMKRGDVQAAGLWRNEYRSQNNTWEKTMLDAFHADESTDDLAFIMQTARTAAPVHDIRTAHDIVVERWPR